MLAIIGGTGLYQLDGLTVTEEHDIDTPFGKPSAPVIQAQFQDHTILFLPRHGRQHNFLPHEINYRANIFALKSLGARQVLSVSAVGSLREDLAPGHFVMPSQYFDFIKGEREKTFFGDGLAAHVSTAMPTCAHLRDWVVQTAQSLDMDIHNNKTYVCVDGPRLGTKAESHFFRLAGCDIVGMTNVPEVFLAREAQLAYATIGVVTDYDCWMEDPEQHVTVAAVIARYGESMKKIQHLLKTLLSGALPETNSNSREALAAAVMTPEAAIPAPQKAILDILQQ